MPHSIGVVHILNESMAVSFTFTSSQIHNCETERVNAKMTRVRDRETEKGKDTSFVVHKQVNVRAIKSKCPIRNNSACEYALQLHFAI